MRLKEMLLTMSGDVQTTEIPSVSRGKTELEVGTNLLEATWSYRMLQSYTLLLLTNLQKTFRKFNKFNRFQYVCIFVKAFPEPVALHDLQFNNGFCFPKQGTLCR